MPKMPKTPKEVDEAMALRRLHQAAPDLLAACKLAKESGMLAGRAYTAVCAAIEKAGG